MTAPQRPEAASVDAVPGGSTGGAGVREWLGLTVLTLPVLLVSMDMTVLHLALPAITADLRPSSTGLLWIVDIYAFMVAGLLITMAAVGDRIGRRRLLLIGAAGFAAASVAAAFAPTGHALIAARAALGIAGATLAPSTLALISTMFTDPRQRSTATSVWVTSFLAGAALGPILGGLILQTWWWGAVFLVGVPVMVLLLAAGPALLPEYRNPTSGPLDLTSAALSLTSILGVVYLLKESAAWGPRPFPVLVGVAGVTLGVLFVRRQGRLTEPLLDLSLLRAPGFAVALGVLTVGSVVLAGSGFLTAQYLQLVLGLSPLAAGLWTLPPLGAGVAAIVLGQLAHRAGAASRTVLGLGLAAAGLLVLTRTPNNGVTIVVTGLSLLFAGLMPVLAVGVETITAVAPPDRAGAAAALSETTQELGGALGVAILGSTAIAVYRHQMDPALAGQPASTRSAAGTLAGALSSGGSVPPAVIEGATAAFTAGLHAAMAVGAGLVTLTAVVALAAALAARRPGTARGSRP